MEEEIIDKYNMPCPSTPEEWEIYRKYYENRPESRSKIINGKEYIVIDKFR